MVKTNKGKFAHAGIGGGKVFGMVANTTAVNSTVETSGVHAHAGIGGGVIDRGTVANTTAVNSTVETSGVRAYAGIGGGVVEGGTVANTAVVDSKVETLGEVAYAGIGGGVVEGGTVANTAVVDSMVKTSGVRAYVGIGGGLVYRGATVANTTAVNSTVETSGVRAFAGIGGGLVNRGATVANTTAVNSKVETSGVDAYAGIGGGLVEGVTVANTTAVNSKVETLGERGYAGIGGGLVSHGATVANTIAVNSTVETSGKYAYAGITGGNVHDGVTVTNTTSVNSYVIMKKDFGPESNKQLLCQKADPRMLTANCASGTEFLDALDFSYGDVCPVNAATASTAATAVITTGTLVAASGLGLVGYSSYQWITGYQGGGRGQELVMKPLTRGKELASAAVNSVRGLAKALRHPLTFRQTQQQSAAVAELPTESRATTQAIEIAAPNTTVHDSVYEDVSHLTAKSSPTAPEHGNTYENVSQQNSNSQGIQGTRKRMNRQKVPTEHKIRENIPKIVTKFDNTIMSASKFVKKEAEALQVKKNILESNRKTKKTEDTIKSLEARETKFADFEKLQEEYENHCQELISTLNQFKSSIEIDFDDEKPILESEPPVHPEAFLAVYKKVEPTESSKELQSLDPTDTNTNVQESVAGSSDKKEAYDPLVDAETDWLLPKEEHREATRKETKKARRNHQPPQKYKSI